jgi:hypothetical protein
MRRQKILLKGVKQAFGTMNQFEYHKINVRRKLSLTEQNLKRMCDEIKAILEILHVDLLRIKVSEKSVSVLVSETQDALLDAALVRRELRKIV